MAVPEVAALDPEAASDDEPDVDPALEGDKDEDTASAWPATGGEVAEWLLAARDRERRDRRPGRPVARPE